MRFWTRDFPKEIASGARLHALKNAILWWPGPNLLRVRDEKNPSSLPQNQLYDTISEVFRQYKFGPRNGLGAAGIWWRILGGLAS